MGCIQQLLFRFYGLYTAFFIETYFVIFAAHVLTEKNDAGLKKFNSRCCPRKLLQHWNFLKRGGKPQKQ
jgi:hypothetical protein